MAPPARQPLPELTPGSAEKPFDEAWVTFGNTPFEYPVEFATLMGVAPH